jgi:DNA-binding Lrp family transcriptional regulator
MSSTDNHGNLQLGGIAAGTLDEIDLAILHVLQESGRASNQEIGESVGLSPSAVSRRVQALETAGVILGYQAVVNDTCLRRGMTVFVRVTLERQSAIALNAFESAVKKSGSIFFCHLMAGQYDYLLQMKVADTSDYERLHREELSSLPGVARLESNFSVRNVIDSGRAIGLLKIP